MYYLDAETTGLDPELRLTSFSQNQDELIEDYLRWVNEFSIDLDHTAHSEICSAKTGLIVSTLVQSDDLMSVTECPVKYSFIDLLIFFVSKLFGKEFYCLSL